MEEASWVVIAVIAATLMVLAWRRSNPTAVLLVSNISIFAVTMIAFNDSYNFTAFDLGFKTPYFFEGKELWTLITSLFLHSDFTHLVFNMLYLILIGFALGSRMGRWRFLAVYFIGGALGNIAFAVTEWNADIFYVLIGSSGAISALMGAMIMLYPREKIVFPLGPIITNRFSVWLPIMVWFVLQFFLFFADSASPVAYAAHLGGFAAGAGLAWLIRPRRAKDEEDRRRADISPLKALCTEPYLKEMYDYAENAREDETRAMWVERILLHVKCPVCESGIAAKGKGFECRNGHKI
ncbi:MAG: rhomboid family intramembrane serine protease [Methanomassiliicoccaceae archaeon]|jgi:membrane associated rhomboid family serine protease|nr:rhomboid family intramembrane serine protease [Methanomassiliicoccaceae archaeon]